LTLVAKYIPIFEYYREIVKKTGLVVYYNLCDKTLLIYVVGPRDDLLSAFLIK